MQTQSSNLANVDLTSSSLKTGIEARLLASRCDRIIETRLRSEKPRTRRWIALAAIEDLGSDMPCGVRVHIHVCV